MSIKLPAYEDGVNGLLGLAELLAVPESDVYRFLGFIRDNANGSKVVLKAREILAARVVAHEPVNPKDVVTDPAVHQRVVKTGETYDDAARALSVGTRLYQPDQRNHFNKLVKAGRTDKRADPNWVDQPLSDKALPTAADGVDGLLGMIPTFGITDEELFKFLGWLRYSSGAVLAGKARCVIAARMVLKRQQAHEHLDLEAARLEVAKQLGYPKLQRPNFYKRVEAGLQLLDAERSPA